MKSKIIKLSLILGLTFIPMIMMGQTKTLTLKTGTQVELQSMKTIFARDVEIGDNVKFKVISDIKSGSDVLIPAGCLADGRVTEAKKSSLAGTKGRLNIEINGVTLEDGTKIPLTGSVRVAGKNKTPLAVITSLFLWPCIFIPGTAAVLPEGYNATATVLTNTDVKVTK